MVIVYSTEFLVHAYMIPFPLGLWLYSTVYWAPKLEKVDYLMTTEKYREENTCVP